ncbi:MAG: hypothetical protein WCP82_06005 [Alphaproteobacteria bacterium]
MSEAARLMLWLALAGAGITLLGSAAIWIMDPLRQMRRAMQRVIKTRPDTMLLSPASGRGVGVAFDSALLAVCWNNGAWCLIYRLDELAGAELLVDGQIVGSALRGEPSQVLDPAGGARDSVVLRLIFDDPRHPDFALDLWTHTDPLRGVAPSPSEAIAQANSWMARTEAILRKSRPVVAAAASVAGYAEDVDEDGDEDSELPF